MAENTRPADTLNNNPHHKHNSNFPRLDLSKPISYSPSKRQPMTTNRSFTNSNSGLVSPVSNQPNSEDAGRDLMIHMDPSRSLISPPPEEELRRRDAVYSPAVTMSASKRKRSNAPTLPHISTATTSPTRPSRGPSTHLEATPNPKPRKQVRHRNDSDASLPPSPTRAVSRALTATPTGKNTQRALIESPHVKNPNADYIPAVILSAESTVGQSARRRRSTRSPSIVPYEPPTEEFEPPREVILTPSPPNQSAKKSSRKSKARNTLRLDTTPAPVKKEPPEIDLTEPMPPASPTDDPLLLSGPPEEDFTPRRQKNRPVSPFKNIRSSPAKSRQNELHLHPFLRANSLPFNAPPSRTPRRGASPSGSTLPPSSPIEDELPSDAVIFQPAPLSSEESMDMDQPLQSGDYDGPLPLTFEDAANKDAASDSSDEEDTQVRMGEGEYTGKWTEYFVNTQRDPPSSATKLRRSMWGNPASPYPHPRSEESIRSTFNAKARLSNVLERKEEEPRPQEDEEEGERDDRLPLSDPAEPEDEDVVEDEDEEREVREMSMEPDLPTNEEEEEDHEEREVREMSVEKDPINDVELEEPVDDLHASEGPELEADPEPVVHSLAEESSAIPFPRLLRLSAGFPRRVAVEPEAYLQTEQTHINDDSVFKTPAVPADRLARASMTSLRLEDLQTPEQDPFVAADDAGDSDKDVDVDDSMVRITSSDPRAAARAAAILKQHDYDCYTRIEARRRRSQTPTSHKTIEEFAKSSRRKTLGDSGISKSTPRKSRGGVIGEVVFMPDSPAITLKGLLRSVEKDVAKETELARSVAQTPQNRLLHKQKWKDHQTEEWTRDNWKLLDMCFTDERYQLGGGEDMADVDLVDVDSVVERFVEIIEEVYWPWEELLDRARALQKKQRGGSVAPSSRPSTPAPLDKAQRRPTMEVPDFTPLGRRALPPRKPRQPILEQPAMPSLLSAPRYSHLLNEARAVSHSPARTALKDDVPIPEEQQSEASYGGEQDESDEEDEYEQVELLATPERVKVARETPSLGGRMKGLIYSYLPTLSSKNTSKVKRVQGQHPGLPLPPDELLNKHRGPIITPARPIPVKPVPPKELVNLHHAPLPQPVVPSRLPRAKPKRLVELQPVPSPPEPTKEPEIIRPRRSSGSVKDLIMGFEDLDNKRKSSSGSFVPLPKPKAKVGTKPTWRP